VIASALAHPLLALPVVLASAAACSLLPSPDPRAELTTRLRAAEARWADAAIDDYRFTIRVYCLCPFQEPVDVEVEDGRVASVTTSGQSADMSQVDWYPLRIETAFRWVEENLEADEIDAAFDPAFGYPTTLRANPDLDMYDEEVMFDITDFAPAP
jgi:hypothetical protein